MRTDNADRRDAHRALSAALETPHAVPDRVLDRALELLGSDAKRVRVTAAWVFGIAAETPERVLPYAPPIAARLGSGSGSDDGDDELARALAHIARADPDAIERELRAMDDDDARRCREALWGQVTTRTVVETPDDEDPTGAAAMGSAGGDNWGWIGGGSSAAHRGGSDPDRRRPPTERPPEPATIDGEYDRYTPVETIHRGGPVDSFKVVYRTPDGGTAPGLFKRFHPPEDAAFGPTFDRRVRMWQSIDDHDAILPVVDRGTDPDPWVVTAYEDAAGVGDLRRADRTDAAVWTLRTVAESLRFAHARGVIHGGLTPGAIVRSPIITEPNAWRYPRVTDWGYLGLLEAGALSASIPDRYLAPEHANADADVDADADPEASGTIDGATDVYGFGAIAVEALGGRVASDAEPGSASNPDGDAGPPRSLSLPSSLEERFPDLESVLRRCLAERKAERFETVQAMTAAFRDATEGIDG